MAGKFRRQDPCVRILPAVVPEPCQVIDLNFFGCSNVHSISCKGNVILLDSRRGDRAHLAVIRGCIFSFLNLSDRRRGAYNCLVEFSM
jgi:hypothetical protein